MLAQRPRFACFVLTHQAPIPGDIGGEDRGEMAGSRHWLTRSDNVLE
jgi:hypothetical protein